MSYELPITHRTARTAQQTPTSADMSPDESAWDAFVASHPLGHILQTSRWGRLKSAFGWAAEQVVLHTIPAPDAPILGGASLLFRSLPWGQTLAYVPKGPLVDWTDVPQTRAVLTMIKERCRKRRAAVLKIEPELPASPALAETLVGHGFRLSEHRVQPLSTIHLDLDLDEEAILGQMKPKWRYNIRLAGRKGVTVRQGTETDMPMIQKLLEITGTRDGFHVHSSAYYALATELFIPAGLATWLVAEHSDEMLAAIAVFALGCRAWYMWGASSDSGRNLMPNHALQWAAIRWAKGLGCQYYDLWGIPDQVGEKPDAYSEPESWGDGGLWGVHRFKQGFGGHIVRYIGAWDLPLSATGYALYRGAMRLRNPDKKLHYM